MSSFAEFYIEIPFLREVGRYDRKYGMKQTIEEGEGLDCGRVSYLCLKWWPKNHTSISNPIPRNSMEFSFHEQHILNIVFWTQ